MTQDDRDEINKAADTLAVRAREAMHQFTNEKDARERAEVALAGAQKRMEELQVEHAAAVDAAQATHKAELESTQATVAELRKELEQARADKGAPPGGVVPQKAAVRP